MFPGIAITIIVLASGYTLFHLYQAYQEYREGAWRRTHGSPFSSDATVEESKEDAEAVPALAVPLTTGRDVMPDLEQDVAIPTDNQSEETLAAEPIVVETLTSSTGEHAEAATESVNVSEHRSIPANRLFSGFRGIINNGEELDSSGPKLDGLPVPEADLVFGNATPAIAQLLPESERRREIQRKDLVAAGYHSRAAWLNLTAIRFVLAFTSLVIVGFWLLIAPPQLEMLLLGLVVVGPLVMWALPPLIVSSRASERRIDVERGLPDVLDMLNMGVSQGLTVPASLKRIGPEIANIHPALSQELRILNQQAHVSSLNDALRGLASRVNSPEVSSFTSLLMQAETTGTSISSALTDYSDSMRSSLRERADSHANAASFKLLFPTALCLMPSVFLFLLGPAIVEMTDFFDNTAGTILSSRSDAIDTLEQRPVAVRLDN